ncbi:MAG TPA: hypothetical protein VGK13_03565 [Methanocellaceae archaeon]
MERKGVNYDVGIEFSSYYLSRPVFDAVTAHRELEIIKNDLHCNAVRISGTDPGRLMVAAEDALEQGLEVWLSPHLPDKSEQETLNHMITCATMAEELRQRWPDLVFILGCELTLFMQGILEGDDFFARMNNPGLIENIKTGMPGKKLNVFLTNASEAIRKVFHGKVTYASAPLEFTVDWSLFDFVCIDHYRETRIKDSYAERLKPYFMHDKPVIVTEVGCCTYQGADQAGARGFMIVEMTDQGRLNGDYVRDEGTQARELTDLLAILDGAGVNGVFVFTFVAPALAYNANPRYDLDMASFSLVKSYADGHGTTYPDMPWEPKESFKAVADYYANGRK